MAERRDKAPPIDPEAAANWVGFAGYIAGGAGIAERGSTPAVLRDALHRCRDDETRSKPARMIRYALEAAESGEPFKPSIAGRA